jgi:hypothetical protein
MSRSRGLGRGCIGHRERVSSALYIERSSLTGWERFFGRRCFAVMNRAAQYRDQANHTRQLADAAWQLDLRELLRCIAKDYDEVAEDIETGATEIRHAELQYG